MRRFVTTAVLLTALLSGSSATACPNCKDSIPNNDAPQATALPGGFNASIYFMLGAVGLVGGLLVRMIVRETRS